MSAATPIPNSGSILDNPQNLQQWSNLIDSLFGTNRTTTTEGTSVTGNSSAADGPLQALIAQLMQTMGQGANSAQMQALLGPIFSQLKEGALPGIQGMANVGGGVYNSSTQKLLQNDALARATAQGGGLMIQQQNNMQTQLAALLAILARSTATQTQQTGNRQQQSTGGNAGNAARAALGAAGARQAANAIKNLLNPKNPAGTNSTGEDFEGDRNSNSGSNYNGTGGDFENIENGELGSFLSDPSTELGQEWMDGPRDTDIIGGDLGNFWETFDLGDNDGMGGGSESDFSWMGNIFDSDGDWGDYGGSFDYNWSGGDFEGGGFDGGMMDFSGDY